MLGSCSQRHVSTSLHAAGRRDGRRILRRQSAPTRCLRKHVTNAVSEPSSAPAQTKTALGKLKVGQLRSELATAGLPQDGLKAALVERLLAYQLHQQPYSTAAEHPAEMAVGGISAEPTLGESFQEELHEDAASAAAVVTAAESEGTAAANDDSARDLPTEKFQGSMTEDIAEGASQQQPQRRAAGSATAAVAQVVAGLPQEAFFPCASGDVPPTGLAVQWLGTSSGAPSNQRNISSILLRTRVDTFMVDAGEGTVRQLMAANINPASIRRLFITHMHGDHCFGIPGVLRTIDAALRAGPGPPAEPIYIYGPPGVQGWLEAWFRATRTQLCMAVVITELAVDIDATSAPREAAPGIFLARLGPQQRLPEARLSALLL